MTKAKIYPNGGSNPTIEYSDNTRPNIGVCFSGGGSRSLTCTWGQLIGLTKLSLIKDIRYTSSASGGNWAATTWSYLPDEINDADFLGTLHSPAKLSLDGVNSSFDVNKLPPDSLGNAPTRMFGEMLGKDYLMEFLVSNALYVLPLVIKGDFSLAGKTFMTNFKYAWATAVGEGILKAYNLKNQGEYAWQSTKSFTLSAGYAKDNFPTTAPDIENFNFVKEGRPFPIINTNTLVALADPDNPDPLPVQTPVQVTPVSSGARGQSPTGAITGGGTVETYGFGSTLEQANASNSPVNIKITTPYSLIDIASSSSAFFAESIASVAAKFVQKLIAGEAPPGKLSITEQQNDNLKSLIAKIIPPSSAADDSDDWDDEDDSLVNEFLQGQDSPKEAKAKLKKIVNTPKPKPAGDDEETGYGDDPDDADDFGWHNTPTGENYLDDFLKWILQKVLNKIADEIAEDLVKLANKVIPKYNYWPLGTPSTNQERGFTDAGNQEDTAVNGLLAQTDTGEDNQEPIRVISFLNTDVKLARKGNSPTGQIIVADQVAPLFGICADPKKQTYKKFTDAQRKPGTDEFDPRSLNHVFENSVNPATGKTFFVELQEGLYATSCGADSFATAKYDKLGVAPAFHAQELVTITNPLVNVTAGRKISALWTQNAPMMNWQNGIGDPNLKKEIEEGQKPAAADDAPFKNFPNYATGAKIGLIPKEANCLSQMWAWAVADDASRLKSEIESFINGAKAPA